MKLTAYKNRSGTITIPIQHDPAGGNQYIDLPLTASVIEFKAGGKYIDSTGPKVSILDNEATLEIGALDIPENLYDAVLTLYNVDYPLGKPIAGPGLPNTIELDFRAM